MMKEVWDALMAQLATAWAIPEVKYALIGFAAGFVLAKVF